MRQIVSIEVRGITQAGRSVYTSFESTLFVTWAGKGHEFLGIRMINRMNGILGSKIGLCYTPVNCNSTMSPNIAATET